MNTKQYFAYMDADLTINKIKSILNINSSSTISMKNKNNTYTTDEIIKICKAVNYSPTKALIDLNIIKQDDINKNATSNSNNKTNIGTIETTTLIIELLKRLRNLDENIVNTFNIKGING
ncbi:MAG: hypothetical protein LBT99_02775 [Bifidobacteriaceae bacterium]|nr:hypothetical protein [Bifidobacteriaceae bacterium]